jgi:hypothetical protein
MALKYRAAARNINFSRPRAGSLLKPGAQFLDYDLFRSSGGIETHIAMMQEAGMTRVSCAWDDGHATVVVAHGKRMF